MAKKPAPTDWHWEDIKASLRKTGTNLTKLSHEHGYKGNALQNVTRHCWPKAERIIAERIGYQAHQLWPSRYRTDGTPKSGRGERGIGRYKAKCSAASNAGKVNQARAS